ncbi:hypothetical protein M9458_001810, partial [Cirrhinus mrigala]
ALLGTRQKVTCCSQNIIRCCCMMESCLPVSPSPIILEPLMLSCVWSPRPRTTPPSLCTHHMRSCC